MNSLTPPSPKPPRWLPVAVVLLLLTGGGLLFYASSTTKASPAASGSITPGFYTQAANTLAALETASTSTPPPPTDTPTDLPTATAFPQYNFTPPGSSSAATASSANYCDNSIYISDVTIPDGTVMAPGASYVKTWAFQNTGSCTWSTNYQLVFVSGDQMGGTATNLTVPVAPTQQIQVSVSLVAPTAGGTYTGYWRLSNAQGSGFGGIVFVKIVVSNSASTGTPTGTPASAGIATSGPILTTTPTATSAAAATSSPTFTATATPGQ